MRRRARTWMRLPLGAALLYFATLAFSTAAFAQTGNPKLPGETPVFKWLESTSAGAHVRESDWLFPIIEAVHVLGIVFLAGAGTLLALRLLNRGFLRHKPTSEVAARLQPVMWWSFALMLTTGSLMFISEAWQCYTSWAFRIKLGLLLAVGLNALIFQLGAYRTIKTWEKDPVAPASARAAAWISMALWVCIVFAGRGIAYW